MGKISFEEIPVYLEKILEKLSEMEQMITALRTPEKEPTKLLTIREAAELVHLKVSTIYGKISRKEIPYIKMDKAVMFEEEVLMDWVKRISKERQSQTRSQSLYAKAEDFLQKRKAHR